MRTGKLSSIVVVLATAALILTVVPALAQESEEFPAADGTPLSGYTRSDGIIVLDDSSFCRHLLGSAFGDRRLTYVELLDRSKKQKKARAAAFQAGDDEAAVNACAAALAAFRAEDAAAVLPGWAQRAPVVPAALEPLLPEDFVAQPLAQAAEIGAAARTSGRGDLVSAPFSVTPGPWLAALDAVGCDEWSGALRDARDPERAFELADTREYLYELDGGFYYWDVTASDCEWSVDLVPVVLGPEPTPTPEPRAVVPALFGPKWNPYPDAENSDHLTAAEAREAVLAAGLTAGECHQEKANRQDRVWRQEPIAGTLVEYGSPVDIWVSRDCEVYLGDRVLLE